MRELVKRRLSQEKGLSRSAQGLAGFSSLFPPRCAAREAQPPGETTWHGARLFPGCAFVVGADTAKRIIDPRYYGNSQAEMVSALAEIRHLGCSFIVGGREDAGGRFLTLEGVLEKSGLPESLRGMFLGLDESAFREDLSSTSIRAGAASAGL